MPNLQCRPFPRRALGSSSASQLGLRRARPEEMEASICREMAITTPPGSSSRFLRGPGCLWYPAFGLYSGRRHPPPSLWGNFSPQSCKNLWLRSCARK